MQFIKDYARHSAARDFAAIVAQFAETFLVAGPAGAQCIRAADFARILPKRAELFATLGCQSSELLDVQESWLGSRYAHLRTTWRFTFRRAETTETVDSESLFLIDTGSDPYRIVAYVTPRDITETLREHGIAT